MLVSQQPLPPEAAVQFELLREPPIAETCTFVVLRLPFAEPAPQSLVPGGAGEITRSAAPAPDRYQEPQMF